MLLVRHYN